MAEVSAATRHSRESGHVRRMRRRVLWSSYLGGVVEWYDFYLYATASALVFNVLFFPSLDSAVGIIASFGTLAVGWVARPIGGLIVGHFGDILGRKKMLMITFLGMGTASALIGLLPTYAVASIWAPILLVGLRLVQGLCAGGEYGGAVLMSVEHAPTKRRGLFSSVSLLAVSTGVLLANGVFLLVNAVLSNEALLSWGWRVLFLVSLSLVAVTYWVRHSIEETVNPSDHEHPTDDLLSLAEGQPPAADRPMLHRALGRLVLGASPDSRPSAVRHGPRPDAASATSSHWSRLGQIVFASEKGLEWLDLCWALPFVGSRIRSC